MLRDKQFQALLNNAPGLACDMLLDPVQRRLSAMPAMLRTSVGYVLQQPHFATEVTPWATLRQLLRSAPAPSPLLTPKDIPEACDRPVELEQAASRSMPAGN